VSEQKKNSPPPKFRCHNEKYTLLCTNKIPKSIKGENQKEKIYQNSEKSKSNKWQKNQNGEKGLSTHSMNRRNPPSKSFFNECNFNTL